VSLEVVGLEEHDAVLEADEARELARGVVSPRIQARAREARGYDLRLFRQTSRGLELVHVLPADRDEAES
jgi:hypothetical protein